MKPISMEKRLLIVEAKQRKESDKNIALWLNVSESSVKLIWRLFRNTGSVEPKPYPGAKPRFTEKMKADVIRILGEKPDMTLEEIIDELCLPIQKSRLSQWLIDAGYPYKKNTFCH
jgi:transposase